HTEEPFQEGGIGRVVREIYKDGSFGPVYFIRYESYARWDEANTGFPFYTRSKDTGFAAACEAMLNNKLMVLQWKDEDDGNDTLYAGNRNDDHLSALSYFHRKDGKVVMLWKKSKAALSNDEGATFSTPVKVPTLLMSGGKNWGQRTEDGRYAMCYNPIDNSEYRYPLIIVTGNDGIIFDDMLLVQGEVPPRRFFGRWKDFGPCYTRGIVEGNGNPPGNDMWITYSMNKEDMWITRVPVPVMYSVNTPVNDDFNALVAGEAIPNWNTYSPQWAPVAVASFPDIKNKSLQLTDEDPYDYARAIRVFKESTKADLRFRVYAGQSDHGELSVDVTDRYGNRPVRISFTSSGEIEAVNGNLPVKIGKYKAGSWYDFRIAVNAGVKGSFDLFLNGKKLLSRAALAEAVKTVERISFRTGPYRDIPNEEPEPPLPGADEKAPKAVYYVDDVEVKGEK
ncbi:MAG TPA: six-hairpin glycosidase, partial [Agriterribacter sp.]|nr:six-hairpin glycosidase [Agriterribacter sp.]